MFKVEVKVEEIAEHLNKAFIGEIYAFMPIGEMAEWWKYAVNYGYYNSVNFIYLPKLIYAYKNLTDKNTIKESSNISYYDMRDDDFIVFEFPDEDTALYFKMKYCS